MKSNMKRVLIGVDWGGTFLKVGILDSKLSVRIKKIIPTKEIEKKKDFLSKFPQIIKSILKKINLTEKNVRALGIGAPGIIDVKKGYIYVLPNVKGWEGVNLKKLLERRFKFPVFIDNDANLIALAESRLGAGKNFSNFLCLTLGTGVGGGLILNKKLHRPRGISNCEAGHFCIDLEGKLCACGAKGCIETFVGNKYLIDFYKTTHKKLPPLLKKLISVENEKELTPKILYKAALTGDKDSIKVFKRLARALGFYITGVINLLGLEAVIIGGGIASSWRLISKDIKKIVREYAMPPFNRTVKILKTQLKEDAGILGAGILAKEGVGV